MRESEEKRYNDSAQDLINLNAASYCDLGPGKG
jgi:hypothetical protein